MPGSKYLWFRWTQGGKRHAVSLKTADEAEAITKARALLAEGLQAAPLYRDIYHTIGEYLKVAQERRKRPMRPGTAKKQGAVLYKFAKDCGVEYAGDVTSARADRWLEQFKNPETAHTYARSLHTFVTWLAEDKRLISGVDFEIPERAKSGRKNWLKSKDANALIEAAASDEMKFILYAGFHAGLRKDEIINARVGWFDLELGRCHVQEDKATGFKLKDRDERMVPLTKGFHDFLRGFLANRNVQDYAIAPDKQKGVSDYRYDFRKSFETHVRRNNVNVSIHDMRRSFASQRVSAGESVYIVAKWLGDRVDVVERSYGHLSPSAGDVNRVV